MNFNVDYIKEPYLKFKDGKKAKDPRIGLLKYGPRTPSKKTKKVTMKLGLIGSNQSVSSTQFIFKQMRGIITSKKADEELEKHNIPFPGVGPESPLNISIETQKRWREYFTSREIAKILGLDGKDKKIEKTLDLIEKKLKILYEKETPPDVAIISIPMELYEACKSAHQKKPKIQQKGSDFHNRIKLLGMANNLPTQLIHPHTLRGKGTQSRDNIAWNLAVGLLYKSQKGHPWKIAELEEDTCFAGITFYRERDGKKTKAAMAQVFLDTGESFIIRGDRVKDIKGRRQNHLSSIDARRMIEKILNQYRKNRKTDPNRLVLHKSSNFWDEETEGILEAASDIHKLDLITIRTRHPLRLFSSGIFPPLRGTLISSPGGKEHYLYTTGYIPTLATYPGQKIPKPIVIRPDDTYTDTPIQMICKEILAFTKLDWNSSIFCKKVPVTLEVSRRVSGILAESKAKDMRIDPHYFFYM